MTNIQAIDLLKGLEQSLDDYCELNDEGETAFRMAITALEVFGISEQLPSAQPEPCEDAVSRHRLLSDLEELIVAWEKYPVMAEQRKGVEAAIGYVKSIPSVTPKAEQRWIPVSERLPEKDGDYLVTGRKGAVDKRKYEDGRWYGGWAVLAYMPLPEPYREEGGE